MSAGPAILRDRYELLEVVGAGGQGCVWRAWDRQHDRPVAVKERHLRDGDDALVLAEARMLLDLRPHAALPVVRDDFFEGGRYFLIIDWIEGARPDPASSYEETLHVLGMVAAALDHLHGHDPPICHRDVKAANVVVGGDRVVLVDFGLASRAGVAAVAGTRDYIAPEVIAGAPATPAADVYALAATAHLMLEGHLPEPGRPPRLERVPPEHRADVAAALAAGLATNPARRPTAGGLVAAMRPADAPTNLPEPLQSFLGRDAERGAVEAALAQARLVTLVGPGGVGKTALALEAARRARRAFPAGVWFVDLVAAAPEGAAGSDRLTALVSDVIGADLDDRFASGRTLLVLDTCERDVDAVAAFAESVLERYRDLWILATSRVRLRARGEHALTVDPLMPGDAESLFRARAGARAGPLDDRALATLLGALDGLPLAIELAAARSGELTLAEMVDALAVPGALLTDGPRTRPRHETIDAVVRWSWDLLSQPAQECLRRISVFAVAFRADAVGEVAAGVDATAELEDASLLLRAAPVGGVPRLRLLDTVRDFAAARLKEAGELAPTNQRLARWADTLLDEVLTAKPGSPEHSRAVALIGAEAETIGVVAATGGPVAISAVTKSFDLLSEAARPGALETALRTAIDAAGDAPDHAVARAWQMLAALLSDRAQYDEAQAALDRSSALAGSDGAPLLRAAILDSAGVLAGRRGDIDAAAAAFEEGLAVLAGDASAEARRREGPLRRNLATAHTLAGRLDDAHAIALVQVQADRDAGDVAALVGGLAVLAHIAAGRGDHEQAAQLNLEAVDLCVRHGFANYLIPVVVNLAMAWAAGSHVERAAIAWGVAEALLEDTGFAIPPSEFDSIRAELERVAAAVGGAAAFDALTGRGRTLAPADLLDTARLLSQD